jgi:hypothetical protein
MGQIDNTRYLKKGSVVAINDHGGFSLKEAGISKGLSSRAQKIAAIPQDEFEKAISDGREAGKSAITWLLIRLTELWERMFTIRNFG